MDGWDLCNCTPCNTDCQRVLLRCQNKESLDSMDGWDLCNCTPCNTLGIAWDLNPRIVRFKEWPWVMGLLEVERKERKIR